MTFRRFLRGITAAAALAVAGTASASSAAYASSYPVVGEHWCCPGGQYLRSLANGQVAISGGQTQFGIRVFDVREDGMCARVWIQAFRGSTKLIDTTGTDCDSNPSTSALAFGSSRSEATSFQYQVGRIRQSDGYISFTRYGPYPIR
jgi:hypothetical protein